MVAAAIGNTHLMQLLIAHGASIDKTSKQSATALIVATGGGQIDAVRLLLSKGASVNHADNSGWRPLSIAAHKGHEDIARLLIKHHAGLELSTQKGWTPLMTATKAGHLNLVRLLLEQKANINHKSKAGVSALMLAAGNGDTEIAELLVHNGASVDEADKDGQTPLIYAEEKGHYEAARLLIRVKAAIDQPDSLGRTPLLIAVQKGQTSLASLLIANGATIDRADNSGSTPLTIACDKNHPDILKLLLGSLPNRAAIDARTPKNITLLMHAARSGHTEIADILLSHGATINLPANGGWTPLMSAVLAGHKTMVELLISRGAEIDRGKQDGWTALMIACQIGHAKIVDLLLDKARFSIPQLAKMIRAASINGHAKVLELLFEKAKTSAIFSKTMLRFWDSNPAEFAIKNGHADALAVLMKNGIRPDLSSQTVWQDLMKALDKGNAELLHLAIDELPSSLLWSSLSSFGQGTSPVHLHVQQALIHAIRQDRQDIVKLLMKAGAKPDFLDTNATTPVQVAIQEGNLPMLQLLLGPDVKLNRHKPDDKLSAELLLAISSEPPDPLLIDTLIDFDNAALMKKGGFGFKLDFQQLADRVSQLLMAAQKDKNNPRLQLSAIITMLCGEFGLSYLAANTLADAILQIAGIYATDLKKDVARPTASAPTAAQLRVAFAESIVSSQLLQDLMRYDDQAPEQCYPNATLMPELARKLVRNTARQAGLLVVSAESVLSEPDAALAKFLNTLTPITTSQQIRDFMSGAGWHPMVAALVAECWNSLDKPPAKAGLIAAISQRLSTPEFAEKIEYQSSDAARHYLLGQLSRLRDLMRI